MARRPTHPHSTHTPEARPASAVGAMARGASAFGAAAVGALAIGRAAIGRIAVGKASVKRLEIEELVVGRLQIDAGGAITRAQVAAWLAAYERAWRTPGTEALAELFVPDATYSPGPFAPTLSGLPAIDAFWAAERAGPDEPFRMRSELIAIEGDVGVARVEVDYERPKPIGYRDLWVIAFAPDGRCRAFEEWPFAPDQRIARAEPAEPRE